MSYTGRANSRNSLKEGKNKNVSNSNITKSERLVIILVKYHLFTVYLVFESVIITAQNCNFEV